MVSKAKNQELVGNKRQSTLDQSLTRTEKYFSRVPPQRGTSTTRSGGSARGTSLCSSVTAATSSTFVLSLFSFTAAW